MYTTLIFRRSNNEDDLIFPDQSRAIVTEAIGASNLKFSAEFFTRNDAGIQQHELPIIYDGGRGALKVIGVGHKGSALLADHAGELFSAMMRRGFYGVDTISGEMKLEYSRPHMYAMRNFIPVKKLKHVNRFWGKSVHEVANELESVILSDLERLAWQMDEELIARGIPSRYSRGIPNTIEFIDGVTTSTQIKPGVWVPVYRNISFSMPVLIDGPWTVGRFRSLGYGLIRKANLALNLDSESTMYTSVAEDQCHA